MGCNNNNKSSFPPPRRPHRFCHCISKQLLSVAFVLIFSLPALCQAKAKPNHQQDAANGIHLSQTQSDKLSQLFTSKNVVVQFDLLFQQDAMECPLLTLEEQKQHHASNKETLFRIQTSTINNSILLEFSLGPGLKKVVAVGAAPPLSDGHFHKILFSLEGTKLTLVQDCRQLLRINDFDLTRFGFDHPQHVFIGAETDHHQRDGNFFCHRIREFTVDAGDILEAKCPDLEVLVDNKASAYLLTTHSNSNNNNAAHNTQSVMPGPGFLTHQHRPAATVPTTSSQPPSLIPPHGPASSSAEITSRISSPTAAKREEGNEKIDQLQSQMNHWSVVLQRFEARIKKIELFQRGCSVDKQVLLPSGYKSRNLTTCVECQCLATGKLNCGVIGCKKLDCAHPVDVPGQCCPVCGRQCLYNGQYHENGMDFWPKPCVRCLCNNGHVECQFRTASNCPALNCPPQQQETPPNQCCPVCSRNVDHCSPERNPCHRDATCSPGRYSPICTCSQGFFGNGTRCYDIDECNWDESASEMLDGCRIGTVCINLPGSFRCDCLPGFQKIDERTCLDIIRV